MIQIPTEQESTDIHRVTAQSGVFSAEEVVCVEELWTEFLRDGAQKSGYDFRVFVENKRVLGYICFGPRPLTDGVFDLYWLAVDPAARGRGIGQALIHDMEQTLASQGCRIIVVETSSTPSYNAARGVYHKAGYLLEATLRDFYHPGDDLVIFTKHLNGGAYDQHS